MCFAMTIKVWIELNGIVLQLYVRDLWSNNLVFFNIEEAFTGLILHYAYYFEF